MIFGSVATPQAKGFFFVTSPLRALSLPGWMPKLVRESHSWHPFPFLLPTLTVSASASPAGRMSIDPSPDCFYFILHLYVASSGT